MGFLTRNTMENAKSFNEAKYMLTSKQMIAPAYFILGGNKTGEVIYIEKNSLVSQMEKFI